MVQDEVIDEDEEDLDDDEPLDDEEIKRLEAEGYIFSPT